VAVGWYYSTINPGYAVEFHEAFATIIPSLIKPLEDKARAVRRETIKLIGKLVNHGEWQLDGIVAQLIWIIKSSFAKPSQP
jgi:hypothetical protein